MRVRPIVPCIALFLLVSGATAGAGSKDSAFGPSAGCEADACSERLPPPLVASRHVDSAQASAGAGCASVLDARWCGLLAGRVPSLTGCADVVGGALCAGVDGTCRSVVAGLACDMLVLFVLPPVDGGILPSGCGSLVNGDYCEGVIKTCESLLHDPRCPPRGA